MVRKRALTEEERELFEATLTDARPLKKAPRRQKKRAKPAAIEMPPVAPRNEKKETEPMAQVLRGRTTGIDGNTADRLRRGLLEPQARLDLHGLSERDAHRTLITFLRGAKSRKLRLVLIVTGKGMSDTNREMSFELGLGMSARGVLRAMTPRWLKEPGLAELIVDVREAHRRHGGSGALYVYLRKQSPP